jgi:hypothetical protein
MLVYGVGKCGNGDEETERRQQNDILHVKDSDVGLMRATMRPNRSGVDLYRRQTDVRFCEEAPRLGWGSPSASLDALALGGRRRLQSLDRIEDAVPCLAAGHVASSSRSARCAASSMTASR